MIIGPTESESKEEMDLFIEAMKSIAEEVDEDPQTVLDAPHSTRVSRLDETAAARKPVLRWKPAERRPELRRRGGTAPRPPPGWPPSEIHSTECPRHVATL